MNASSNKFRIKKKINWINCQSLMIQVNEGVAKKRGALVE
jgi:hypothetical protein